MFIIKESTIFSANNARQAAVRIVSRASYEVVSDESGNIIKDQYGNYIYTGRVFKPTVYLRIAKTLNPNIDMSKPIIKGTRVFDWENSIVLKLTNEEIAVLSMLADPFYIYRWDNMLTEQNQNGKKSELYTFFHSSRGQQPAESKMFSVHCNKKTEDTIFVVLSAMHIKPDGSKDKVSLSLKIHQAHMLGLAMTGFLLNQGLYNVNIKDFTQREKVQEDNSNVVEEDEPIAEEEQVTKVDIDESADGTIGAEILSLFK